MREVRKRGRKKEPNHVFYDAGEQIALRAVAGQDHTRAVEVGPRWIPRRLTVTQSFTTPRHELFKSHFTGTI